MQVTGFQLRAALQAWRLRLDVPSNEWNSSKTYYPSQERPDLLAISDRFVQACVAICQVEAAQQEFNSLVFIDVPMPERVSGVLTLTKQCMSLAVAVKLVGNCGRVHAMWKALLGGKKDRYSYTEESGRAKDNEYSSPSVSLQVAAREAEVYARWLSQVKASVDQANSETRDLKIDASLLV